MSAAFAVTYDYPNGPIVPVAPQILASGDTANINSGTFATTNNFNYTLFLDTNLTTQTVNVLAGATLSYLGTVADGRSIVSARADTVASTEIINNAGTISSGSGLFALYMANSIGVTAANTVQINNTGTILGGIMCNGANTIELNLNGTPSVTGSSFVQGGITLTPKIGGTSTLNVGNTTPNTIYTTGGTIQFVSLVHVQNNSTMSIQYTASDIVAITVDAGSILNINADVDGLNVGSPYGADGAVNNSGTINIADDVTKTGAFNTLAGGVTNVRQDVTLSTTNFDQQAGSTYGSVFTDVLNYGSLFLPSATTVNFDEFAVRYEGGYLPGDTYTLVTASNGITVAPTSYTLPPNTLFLTFGTPFVSGNTIQEVITRTPFQTYAQSSMTAQVGMALEQVGASANPPQSFVNILNAVERSTNAEQVEAALRQLAPLISAPVYGLEIQAEMMDQVELRLAEARDRKTYFAGDLAIQNAIWMRPFGDKANQGQIGDSLGYYASTGGFAAGFDRYVDAGFLLGLGGSYAVSHVREKINTASSTEVKSYQFALYGSMDLSSKKYIDCMFAAAANNYDGTRNMSINGLNMTAYSTYSSQLYGIKTVLGKNFSAFNFLQVNPEFSGQYTFAKQYTYVENGASGANLTVSRDNSNVVQLGIGGKLSIPLEWNPGIFVPEFHAMTYYNVVNSPQQSIGNFLEGGGIIIANMPLPRSWLKFGAAVTFAVLDQLQVRINYSHWIADRFTDNSFYINFKWTI